MEQQTVQIQDANDARDRRTERLAALVSQFTAQDMTQAIRHAYLRYAHDIPSSKWSFANRCIMIMQGTSDARGYNQWQNIGRHVKKGAKAIYILVPRMIRVDDDDKDGNEKKSFMAGFMLRPVFRVEDTDGAPLEYSKEAQPKMPPLADVAAKWGINVRHAPTVEGEAGHYSPRGQEIVICVGAGEADGSSNADATFFHELAHAAHGRILKRSGSALRPGQHDTQEAVAELTAAVIASIYGNDDYAGQAYTYIRQYTEGRTHQQVAKICMRVMADVESVLDEIFADVSEAPAEASEI